jgi:predicted DsbA family dithiol-disulfide isomerase
MKRHWFTIKTIIAILISITFLACSGEQEKPNAASQNAKEVGTKTASKGSGPNMDWHIDKKFDLKSPAVDMVMAPDGQREFLLDEAGNLNIYKLDGSLEGTIPVGRKYNLIQPGPEPYTIFLGNREDKAIQILTIDLIQHIDIEGSPFKGPQDAPITLVLFTDFQCPYCARLVPILEETLKTFPKELKLVYKSFPLRMHQYAVDAAKAAVAADKMGKFWEFHDLLFKNYNTLDKAKIDAIREQLKLDKKEFEKYVNDPKTIEKISNDYKNGIEAGVRGTPALFLNGKQVKDRRIEALKQSIKKELGKS